MNSYFLLIIVFLIISSILSINYSCNKSLGNNDFNLENLKSSPARPAESGNIIIDNNWTATKVAGICTGNGTYSEPYIIEDLKLEGNGWTWSCIVIKNSDEFFIIENCTLYTLEYKYSYAINMYNVQNGLIINNNCSTSRTAICLFYCSKINVSINTIEDVKYLPAIYLEHSNNNSILDNKIDNCDLYGIHITNSRDNEVLKNDLNGCGLEITGSIEELRSNSIDSTNKVNGKPLYYYCDEINLGLDNFTNAGQVILINCNQSLISHLNTINGSIGISLYYCNNNTIAENNASYNRVSGIYLVNSNFNLIYGNIVNFTYSSYESDYNGISLKDSHHNNITKNIAAHDYSGVYLYHSELNVISKNFLENNLIGIYLRFSDHNYIYENNVTHNRSGIDIRDSSYNKIERNIAINGLSTYSKGIYLSRGSYNIIKGNKVMNNTYGIEIFWNNYNVISENTVNNNSYVGIILWHECCYNVVSGNNIINNSNNGIYLYDQCNYNTISGNFITKNSNFGIYLRSQSNHNFITENILTENAVCIREEDCFGNFFWDNGSCLYVGKRNPETLIYVGLALLGITILVLLEKRRRSAHKF